MNATETQPGSSLDPLVRRMAMMLKEQCEAGARYSKQMGVTPETALVRCDQLRAVLAALPPCNHPRSVFKQSASGNESWHECADCGAET